MRSRTNWNLEGRQCAPWDEHRTSGDCELPRRSGSAAAVRGARRYQLPFWDCCVLALPGPSSSRSDVPARHLVDFLCAAHQRVWLPVTLRGPSGGTGPLACVQPGAASVGSWLEYRPPHTADARELHLVARRGNQGGQPGRPHTSAWSGCRSRTAGRRQGPTQRGGTGGDRTMLYERLRHGHQRCGSPVSEVPRGSRVEAVLVV